MTKLHGNHAGLCSPDVFICVAVSSVWGQSQYYVIVLYSFPVCLVSVF